MVIILFCLLFFFFSSSLGIEQRHSFGTKSHPSVRACPCVCVVRGRRLDKTVTHTWHSLQGAHAVLNFEGNEFGLITLSLMKQEGTWQTVEKCCESQKDVIRKRDCHLLPLRELNSIPIKCVFLNDICAALKTQGRCASLGGFPWLCVLSW